MAFAALPIITAANSTTHTTTSGLPADSGMPRPTSQSAVSAQVPASAAFTARARVPGSTAPGTEASSPAQPGQRPSRSRETSTTRRTFASAEAIAQATPSPTTPTAGYSNAAATAIVATITSWLNSSTAARSPRISASATAPVAASTNRAAISAMSTSA